MPQNLISLTLTEADHAAIADALSTLESKLSGLISLSADERRSLNKMGEKSETFCRRTLVAMSENPGLIPADVDVAEAQRDMAQFDALGSDVAVRFTRRSRADKSPAPARLNPGPQGTQAPFAGLYSWAFRCTGLARKPFLLAAKALAPGAWGSKACAARLRKPPLGMQGLARKAQSSALGPQMGKVQG